MILSLISDIQPSPTGNILSQSQLLKWFINIKCCIGWPVMLCVQAMVQLCVCVCVCVCVHQCPHTNTRRKSFICSHKLFGLQSASALRKALRRSACFFFSIQHAQISSVPSEEQKTSVTADVAAAGVTQRVCQWTLPRAVWASRLWTLYLQEISQRWMRHSAEVSVCVLV